MSAERRRTLLVLAGAAVVMLTLPRLWGPLRPVPPTVAHPLVPGYKLIDAGPVSANVDPFVGIPDPEADRIQPQPVTDLCGGLHRGSAPPGAVKVAVFTDINCPYCREMDPWLRALDPASVHLTWHDLPLLGDASVAAARAIGAAQEQGQGDAMRLRLNRARFTADPDSARQIAESLDLDADRLIADMHSPAVEARIAETLGLAQRFALPGTPAMIVGGLVAIGRRDEAEFNSVVEAVRAGDIAAPCG